MGTTIGRLPWIHIDEELKDAFQQYYLLHGVRLSLFTPEGERLYPGNEQPDCAYCRLIRQDLAMDARCVELDQRMIARCIREGRMIRYHCHGGMEEAALPLEVDGETLGCIMLGQFRRAGMEASPYQREWDAAIGDGRLVDAFRSSPSFNEETIRLLMETYRFLLGLIARERMIRNRDYDPLMPLIDRLDREPAWSPTLEEACALCARSPSSLNRLCKKATGMAFKPFVIERKLARADQYLHQFPDKTITEIAGELGYDDPLYFSRLYKRRRGISPRRMRKTPETTSF